MPKRKSAPKGFGGGTGDVNPQWFNLTSQAITTTYGNTATTLPRERLPYGNKSQVMEVLKVQFLQAPTQTVDLTAATYSAQRMYITTSSFGTAEPTLGQSSGKVLCKKSILIARTAAAPAADLSWPLEDIIDLTDGAGNGILVATDSIFLGAIEVGVTLGTDNTLGCRLLYRWKNVGLTEYIGIVQSQQ